MEETIMKKSYLLCTLCAVLLAAIPLRTVHAIPIHLEFIVSNFGLGTGGSAAPQDIVSGSILYEALSITSTIDSLAAIDLTIGTHTYSIDEVGYAYFAGTAPRQCIGGEFNSFCNVGPSDYDFRIRWYQNTLIPLDFAYSIGSGETWGTIDFDAFSITAVPIPPALFLFGSGLLGLVGMARRKQA